MPKRIAFCTCPIHLIRAYYICLTSVSNIELKMYPMFRLSIRNCGRTVKNQQDHITLSRLLVPRFFSSFELNSIHAIFDAWNQVTFALIMWPCQSNLKLWSISIKDVQDTCFRLRMDKNVSFCVIIRTKNSILPWLKTLLPGFPKPSR